MNNLFDLLRENKFEEFINILKNDITNNIDVNYIDNQNNYLIQYAILYNQKNIVSVLINKGAKLDIIDSDGRNILYYPIKFKYYDILELLLYFNQVNIGISLINIKDKFGNTPLHYSIIFNVIYATQLLLKNKCDINIKNNDGYNGLQLSIYYKNIDIFNILLKNNNNHNINTINKYGETALHIACNIENYDMVKVLLETKAQPNIQEYEHEFAPIIYSITLNNINIFKLLIKYGADINIQDIYGNTPLHYILLGDNLDLFNIIITHKIDLLKYNLENKLPLHMVFEKISKNTEYYINKLLINTNVNIQNNNGNTILHLLVATSLWKKFIDILQNKKLNIYIINKIDKNILDYIIDIDKNNFLSLVAKSVYNQLNRYETKDAKLIELKKNIEKNDKNKLEIIQEFILKNKKSIVEEVNHFDLYYTKCAKFTTFTGISLDVLIGLIYLLEKYKYIGSPITTEFQNNSILEEYYATLGYNNNSNIHYLNFEISWVYQKIFYPLNFNENMSKLLLNDNIKYIIIPIGIEQYNGGHSNYILFNKTLNEVERFEPNGSNNPNQLNYNQNLLDELLEVKFKLLSPNLKYFKPSDYIPKIGLQLLDSNESFKNKNIGDPGGFCSVWTIWYIEMRINNIDIPRDKLIFEIIQQIKLYNYSFRNIIRSYSLNITKIRDDILSLANIDINNILNETFTFQQINIINNTIKEKIKNILNYTENKRTNVKMLKGTKNRGIIWVK